MTTEREPGSLPKPPTNEADLVPLTNVLEVINRFPLLSVQKTALAEALEKALQGKRLEHPIDPTQTVIPPQFNPNRNSADSAYKRK